jgi:sulfide dehydrogenase cytochrome subunit
MVYPGQTPHLWQLTLLLMVFAILTTAEASTDQAESAGAPNLTAQGCMGCHGPEGNSRSSAIPSIAGLPRDYLAEVLRSYRYGGRFGTLMGRLMQAYSDQELDELADYFSQQPLRQHKQRVDWDLVFKGEQLHRFYCRECHGDLRRAAEEGIPKLNGRWMTYLRWTLQDYLLGVNQADREMSKALIRLVRRHGEAGLESLIHYYGSARPEKPEAE